MSTSNGEKLVAAVMGLIAAGVWAFTVLNI